MSISLPRRFRSPLILNLVFVICLLLLLYYADFLGHFRANVFAVGLLSGSAEQQSDAGLDDSNCVTSNATVSTRWLSAEYARMAGAETQAEKFYKLLVNCNQRKELANFRLGHRSWLERQHADALEIWSPNIAQEFVLADCEFLMEDANPEELLEICQIASRLNPDSAIGWEGIGKAYTELNAPKEALEAYTKALNRIEKKRKEMSVVLAMARLYRNLGDRESIIQLLLPYRESLTSGTSFELGRAYYWNDEPSLAASYFREAINKTKAPTGLHYIYLAEALMKIDDHPAAAEALETAVDIEKEGSHSFQQAQELLHSLDSTNE